MLRFKTFPVGLHKNLHETAIRVFALDFPPSHQAKRKKYFLNHLSVDFISNMTIILGHVKLTNEIHVVVFFYSKT